ncbi:phosphotransferase [Promicromonospora sp. Marseille-Q5078]
MAEATLAGLCTTDREIAASDPAVPALPDLLDPAALAGRLTRATGTPGVVTRPYLRYKPGTSCLLAARWVPDGGAPRDLLVRAYAAHALPKLDKAVRHARRGEVVLVDRAAGLVVTDWTADRDLPGTRLLTGAGPGAGVARLLRHNPERRAVLHLESLDHVDGLGGVPGVEQGGAGEALVRLVRPSAVERTLAGYGLLAETGVRAPRVVARDARLGLVVTQWVAGEPLDALDAAGTLDERGLRDVGAAAATLHASSPAGTGPIGAGPAGAVPVHGDLSLDQLVRDPSGALWLVDGDAARWGAAEDDLGSLAASLVRAHDDVPAAAARLAAVLAGYAGARDLDPRVLRRSTADHLLRRSTEPFRRRERGWAERAARLAARAHGVRDGGGGELGAVLDGARRGARPSPAQRTRPGAQPDERLRVRYAPVAREIAGALAADGRRLRAVVPRGADRLLVVAEEDGRVVAGRWDADPRAARRHAARVGTEQRPVAGGGLVLQPGGADPDLPDLAARVRAGATLVAHRSGRRGVVRDPAGTDTGTYTKVTRPGREPGHVAVPPEAFATPDVVDRGAGYVTSTTLPGRTLHALLRDPAVPDAVLVDAGRATGRGLRRLQQAPAPAGAAGHDADAEADVVARWWGLAAAHRATAEADAQGVVRRVRAGLAGLPVRDGVLTHRDLHDKQLLVDVRAGAGEVVRVGLLDLDLAAVAHPALDLANLLVHLELRAHQGVCPTDRAALVARAVVDGYGGAAPDPGALDPGALDPAALAAWATAARARLAAVYAFRPPPGDVPTDVPGALLADLGRAPTLLDHPLTHLEDR